MEPRESVTIQLHVGEDLASVREQRQALRVTLRIQASPGNGKDELVVRLNDVVLNDARHNGDWVEYDVRPESVQQGANQVVIARGNETQRDPVLRDLQLSIR